MQLQQLFEYREREPMVGGDPKEVLPPYKIKEIRINIRAGAKDLKQDWRSPVELVSRAYKVAGCTIPTPLAKDGWKDFRDMLELAVQVLAKTRGPYAKWRISRSPTKLVDVAID